MPYIPHTEADRKEMLAAIGASSLDDLFSGIPEPARFRGELTVPPSMPEWELTMHLRELAGRNRSVDARASFLGAGAYRHFSPSLVDSLLQRAEFYSAYTPYQPEASQGTLQAIFEFQTIIGLLTGMDVANASLYDGGSAAGEAVVLALSATSHRRILMSRGVHPHYRDVVETYMARNPEVTIQEIPVVDGVTDLSALKGMLESGDVAGVMIQNPNFFGCVEDGRAISDMVHQTEALLLVAVTDMLALGLVRSPGDYDADVAFGEAQGLGLPLSWGGPYVGFMGLPMKYVKRMPGRLAGQTTDHDGRVGYCLTLQAREQHIRREKAVSNICTNQSLCALATTMYVSAMGRQGIREISTSCYSKAHYAASQFAQVPGLSLRFGQTPFFHEWVVQVEGGTMWVQDALTAAGISPGLDLGPAYPEMSGCMLFCATEVLRREDIDEAVRVLQKAERPVRDVAAQGGARG